ncbi:MAG: hypothetical protein OEV06_03365 [Anaerolineae bacterium]|nr:hypothetical protein [Anaerolineae bacterium]
MKFKWPWRIRRKEAGISQIERLLDSTLKPVSARPDFLDRLRADLETRGGKGVFGRIPQKTMRLGLLGLGAVLSGAVLLVAGVRWFVSLLSALGLFEIQRRKKEEEKSLPTQPAV